MSRHGRWGQRFRAEDTSGSCSYIVARALFGETGMAGSMQTACVTDST